MTDDLQTRAINTLVVMDADKQISYTVDGRGTVPLKGLWDTAVTMRVVYEFKNPDWTLVWEQPGDKLGQLEFGNVFWGDRGRLILEWEGGYKPANPEGDLLFNCRPAVRRSVALTNTATNVTTKTTTSQPSRFLHLSRSGARALSPRC